MWFVSIIMWLCDVVRMLQDSRDNGTINIDCVDPLGRWAVIGQNITILICDWLARTALLMAIDNENLEMVEVLLENKVETKDALLHAINEEFVEAVEVLLDHEESIHAEGEPWVSWEWNFPQFFSSSLMLRQKIIIVRSRKHLNYLLTKGLQTHQDMFNIARILYHKEDCESLTF